MTTAEIIRRTLAGATGPVTTADLYDAGARDIAATVADLQRQGEPIRASWDQRRRCCTYRTATETVETVSVVSHITQDHASTIRLSMLDGIWRTPDELAEMHRCTRRQSLNAIRRRAAWIKIGCGISKRRRIDTGEWEWKAARVSPQLDTTPQIGTL